MSESTEEQEILRRNVMPFGLRFLLLALLVQAIAIGFLAGYSSFLRALEIADWMQFRDMMQRVYGEQLPILPPNFLQKISFTVLFWLITSTCLWSAHLIYKGERGTWRKCLVLNIFNSVIGVPLGLVGTAVLWEIEIGDVILIILWLISILAYVPYMMTKRVKDYFE
jgi:hypothetical protein